MARHRKARKTIDAGIFLIVLMVAIAASVLGVVATRAKPVSDVYRHPSGPVQATTAPLIDEWRYLPRWREPVVHQHHHHQAPAQLSPVQAAPVYSSPQDYAASILGDYGWSQDQMSCLIPLWDRESGWQWDASNGSAYGIPQALPGWKMASAGTDWQTNPETQIRWGEGYIQSTYGSPCNAWAHEQSNGWY